MSMSRHGRHPRFSFKSRLYAQMKLSFPIPYNFQAGHTISSAENAVEYNVVDFASSNQLVTLANYASNIYYARFTGITQNPLTPATTTGQMILSRVSSKLTFKNQATATVRIDVWEMYAKQLLDSEFTSVISMVRNGFTSVNLSNPVSAPLTNLVYTQPCNYPNHNPLIRQWFKLKKHKQVSLMPGQTWLHSVSWRTPKFVDFTKVTAGQLSYKGLTKHLLIRVCGDVGWDNNVPGTAYSKTRVDYMEETRYLMHPCLGLTQNTGVVENDINFTSGDVFAINPTTGNENTIVTTSGGVVGTAVQPISTVH